MPLARLQEQCAIHRKTMCAHRSYYTFYLVTDYLKACIICFVSTIAMIRGVHGRSQTKIGAPTLSRCSNFVLDIHFGIHFQASCLLERCI